MPSSSPARKKQPTADFVMPLSRYHRPALSYISRCNVSSAACNRPAKNRSSSSWG